jgi:hypothetical protein
MGLYNAIMSCPKVYLRDFFWMIVVAALVLVWWQERSAREDDVRTLKMQLLAAREHELRALKIQRLQMKVESDDRGGSESFGTETATE